IVRRDGADIGWLQTATTADALFVAQLFVEPALRRQGVGTEVMRRIIGEAARAGQAVTLGVVKTNPAIRLYERLGFTITHEDGRKFFMRCDSVGPMPDRPGGQKETRRDARHDRASPSGIKTCRQPLDVFLQFLRGPEGDLLARLDLDRLAGRGVAAHARGALTDLKDAKSADADAIAFLEMFDDHADEVVEDRL